MTSFLIGRKTNDKNYRIWRFSLENEPSFQSIPIDKKAGLDSTHRLAQVGGSLLDWGPLEVNDEDT